jgi:hypothetical protein
MVASSAASEFRHLSEGNGIKSRRTGNRIGSTMAATGELIRLINYVDDINTTLRRISASIPLMEADERKRLAENIRAASSNLNAVLGQLEKGGQ